MPRTALAAALALASLGPLPAVAADTALQCERLFDSRNGRMLAAHTIVVRDGRIAELKAGRVDVAGARTIDLDMFVPADSIGWIWYDRPHYLVPDDQVGEEAFAVIRDAMAATGMVGISRIVLYRRERAVMLQPRDRGIVVWTLRYGDEVRSPEAYFGELDMGKPDRKQLALVTRLIEERTDRWDRGMAHDPVQDRLLQIIEANRDKVQGVKMSLLDADAEISVRRRLPESARMFTGDDFHYVGLIEGDAEGHSDALLGAFAALAPNASAAIQALDADDVDAYRAILGPTEELSRQVFAAPTYYYKTGVAFLSWLNGHQAAFQMVGGLHAARSLPHLSRIVELANGSGALERPELAAARWHELLTINGIDTTVTDVASAPSTQDAAVDVAASTASTEAVPA